MKRIISVILCFIFLISVCCPMVSAEEKTNVADGRTNEDKWLTLSTNKKGARYFVDMDGNPVHLWGMARCQSHGHEEDIIYSAVPNVNKLTDHYSELNCNFMRLAINFNSICKQGGGTSKEDINKFITQKVDPDVQAIIRSGMYVMLDVHLYPPEAPEGVNGAQFTVQYAYDNYLPFLIELAKKYANEPMVAVIELWNEPYPADQVTFSYDFDIWNKLVREFFIDGVNEIRKYDKRHVLLVSDWNAGWGCAVPTTWDGYINQLDPVYRNTAHSIHIAKDQMTSSYDFYSNWYDNLADTMNLCLLHGEIETEGNLMSTEGMENLLKWFDKQKEKCHYSGVLWRPHNDKSNYVDVWKDWAKTYVTNGPYPHFREIIEAENFGDKSETAEIAKNVEMFGAPSVGTGIKMLPNIAPNKYYEASPLNNNVYQPGSYNLTVTALGDTSDCGGFTVGYKTVSGKVVEIADLKGNNQPGQLYDQTVTFTCDEQIAGFVFFSNETEKTSVGIDRLYLTAADGVEYIKKSKVTISTPKTVHDLEGNVYDVNADLSDMLLDMGKEKSDYFVPMIIMGSVAAVLVILLLINGIILKKRKS